MDKIKITLIDRLDRTYELYGYHGQTFREFLLSNFIPESSIILKVNGQIVDDQNYVIQANDIIELTMVRAYQLPEYCQMLEIWNNHQNTAAEIDSIYTNKILWFNESGICDLRKTPIKKEEYPTWLENKFVEAINLFQLIQKDNLICLPLSGGRDSLALLYLFERTRSRLPDFSFSEVTVAPTVASIGDLNIASEAIRSLGVQDYHILDADYVKETMHLKNKFSYGQSAFE